MSAPQGIKSYSGLLPYILSGRFVLQHGISPSISTFLCAPVPPKELQEQGTLDIRYGNDRLTFPDCKIDNYTEDKNEDGFTRATVTILDRRWKWKFAGVVSGHWNERKGEKLVGQNIPQPLAKNAKQLAEICLKAMGEERYDAKDMPTDVFPEVEWDFTNAAQALAQVCDMFGFRVVLEVNNRVALRKVGVGKQLPVTNTEIQLSATIDPPERPDWLDFRGGPDRYQYDLELEPVLRDFDGQFRNVFELAYTPRTAAGKPRWGATGYTQYTAAEIAAKPILGIWNNYILDNLWKTWRIKEPFAADIWFNGGVVNDNKLRRFNILPLEETILDTETVDKGAGKEHNPFVVEEQEPLIYGLWNGSNHSGESTYHVMAGGFESLPTGDVARLKDPLDPFAFATGKCAKALYQLPWDLNRETGYVQFANPVNRLLPQDAKEAAANVHYTIHAGGTLTSYSVMPAILWLRCSFSVRLDQQEGGSRLHREVIRQMPGKKFNSGTEVVRAADIRFKMGRYKDGPLGGNNDEFLAAAKQYLDQRQQVYQVAETAAYTWPGFKAINPDGAIQQITWEVNAQGFATTRASRNKEEIFSGVSYTERRLMERTKAMLDEVEKRRIEAGGR